MHICGSVNHPGVYYLEEGARIHEAVELAGGMTQDAAGDVINLAEVVCDGEKIYIPSKEELAEGFSVEDPQKADDGLVNINTASLDELKKLPGIGDSFQPGLARNPAPGQSNGNGGIRKFRRR